VKRQTVTVAGIDIEFHEEGDGPPVLFFHSGRGFQPQEAFVGLLARKYRFIAPSHPGFGTSGLPDWIDSTDDIAHIHLALMDQLDLRRVKLIGCSIGGWIAAELATKSPERIEKLVLVGPEGVKLGPRDRLDIPDIFAMPHEQLIKLTFHDPAKGQVDVAKLTRDEMTVIARNNETLALLAWEPYMHNPKLRHRLHRVDMPVLFLRGESDGLISADYLAKYAKLVPHGRVETIAAAGHSPQTEQPEAFVAKVTAFFEQGA